MSEKIESIEDIPDLGGKSMPGLESYNNYEGFKIKTNKREIYILVSNGSSCCENWGHIASEDDTKSFIGAEIIKYRCVDNADYKDCELTKKNAGEYVDVYDCAFIDLETSRGTLQFAVYNSHNGYYGHDIRIVERPLDSDKESGK